MQPQTFAALRRGVEAAMIAGVPQVLVPQAEERIFRLPRGSADLGPRFVQRLGQMVHRELPEDMKWLGASTFHFGYAALWGGLYALAYQKRPVPPLLGGALLGAIIYGITFPRWGGAVQTGTEPPPEARSRRRTVLQASAALTFGLVTALLYGRGPHRAEVELAAGILSKHPRLRAA